MLFRTALGPDWAALAPEIRAAHSFATTQRLTGRATVSRGAGGLARLIAWAFGFPPAGSDVPVTVTMQRDGAAEVWIRDFAGRRFRSRCLPGTAPGRIRERFGPFTFDLDLVVRDGGLDLLLRGGRLFGVALARLALPGSVAREFADDGRFCFAILLSTPFGGQIVHYRGWLKLEPGAAPG